MSIRLLAAVTVLTGAFLAGCRSGDRLLVSNQTDVPIDFGASVIVPACSNLAYWFAGAWVLEGHEREGPGPRVPHPEAVTVTINYRPPIDGLGSTRAVAIVSSTGIVIQEEGGDPPAPTNCAGQPPGSDPPRPSTGP